MLEKITRKLTRPHRELVITFTEDQIKFLELTRTSEKSLTIHQSFSMENKLIDENGKVEKEIWKSFLKEQVKANKIKAKEVHVIIPTSYVIVRHQVMPNLPEKELKQMIHYEIGSTLHLPFELPVIDLVKVKTEETVYNEDGEVGSQVVLVAASGNLVYPIVEGIVENNLVPKSVDIPSLGLYRLFKLYHPEQKADPILIMEIDEKGADLHIFDREILWFTRHIPLEMSSFGEGVKEEVSDAKMLLEHIQFQENYQSFVFDLANEMERAINFFQYTLNNRENAIKSCWIASNLTFPDSFYRLLEQRIEIEAKSLEYKDSTGKFSIEELKGFEVGIGAILREVKISGN